DDLAERRRRALAAELGGLLLGQLRELRLELQVDAVRAVDDRDQRLRRERLELRRELLVPVGERLPGVQVPEQPLELLDLLLESRVARLRLLRDPLEAPLDVVAVGDEQLEAKRLEVVVGHARAGEAVEDDEERVDLPQVPEQ